MVEKAQKAVGRQVTIPASNWGRDINAAGGVGIGQTALRTFREMSEDPTGMSMFQALSLPIRSVNWTVKGGESEPDKAAVTLLEDALTDMDGSMSDLISQITTMFWAGFSMFEFVMKEREDGYIGFDKILLVEQSSITDWKTKPNGSIEAALQMGNPRPIYLRDGLLFRTDKASDNPWGQSIYRAAVRPYKFRRRLEIKEAIGLSRRWAGFPTMTLPKGATFDAEVADGEISDESRAREVVQAVHQDRLMGGVFPEGWDFDLGGPSGNIDSTMSDTIMRKDMEMVRAILGQFLLQGLRRVGTQALAGTLLDIFMYAITTYLRLIADELNKYMIPYFFEYNIIEGMETQPYLVYDAPREVALAQIGQYVMSLTDAGISLNDAPTESFLRSLISGMPTTPSAEQGEPVVTGEPEEDIEEEEPSTPPEPVDPDVEEASRVAFFSVAPGDKPLQYKALTDANTAAQHAYMVGWAADAGEQLSQTDHADLESKLDELVLAALLFFRRRSLIDISAAFWMGYGAPAGPPEAMAVLTQEIRQADAWIGFNGGRLVRVNPAGKSTLFGDIAGELEGQLAAIALLLLQGKSEEVSGLVDGAVRSATRAFSRIDQYSGHVWHAIWSGAIQSELATESQDRVRWVLDAFAMHCEECPQFAREYANIAELLATTGRILPGQGTECDGHCRCHLEKEHNGVWTWL